MIPVYRPYFPPGALDRAHEAIASSWVGSIGPYLEEAEARLKVLFGVRHIVLTSSGTSAMHLVALSLFRRHPEVHTIVCPNGVYAASWNAFLRENRQIVFVDSTLPTWTPSTFEIGRTAEHTKGHVAILLVHNLGGVSNIQSVKGYLTNMGRFDAPIIEDNCEGLFGKYGNKWTGTTCLASATSFYANKTLTAGEGGALFTDDDDLAEFARRVSRQGQSDVKFVHDRLGYNYRMTNVAAAILCGQLDLVDEIRSKKAHVFARYQNGLAEASSIVSQAEEPNTTHAQWMFGIRIPGAVYPEAERYFAQKGIEVRPMFYPASAHTYLRNNPRVSIGNERVAKQLNRECVILPSYPGLVEKDQDRVIEAVVKYASRTSNRSG